MFMPLLTWGHSWLPYLTHDPAAYPVVLTDRGDLHYSYFVKEVKPDGSVVVSWFKTDYHQGGGCGNRDFTYSPKEWDERTKGGALVRPGDCFTTKEGVRVELVEVNMLNGEVRFVITHGKRRWVKDYLALHDLVANAEWTTKSTVPLAVVPPGFERRRVRPAR